MSKDLKLALEIAAKATGREELAELVKDVSSIGPVSSEVEAEAKRLADQLQELARQRDLIDAVNKSKEALTNLEQAALLSKDKLERLRQEQALAGGDAQGMADKERLLASEVKQLESQLVRQATSHTKLTAEMKRAGIDTSNLAGEQKRLQKEIDSASNSAAKLGNDLTGAKNGASGLASGVGNLTRNLVAMAGAYVGISALKEQLLAMFKSGDQAERLQVQLQAVMGSIQGGKEATSWIQNFAQTTPLQLDEVTKTFVRLKAFGLDPMSGTMQSVVDQAYKLGGGFDAVEGISLALGQAWAKQKLQGEEILQLIERGVPVWELLEKVTGKNTAELQKLSSAGNLGRDAIKALMDEMGRSSQGAAVANMSTMSGLISNAKDNLEKFYRMVAENGALDWLKQQLTALNAEFARMAADGSLQQWAKRISDAVVTAGESIKAMVKWIYDWSTALKVLGEAWLGLKMAAWAGQIKALVAQFITIPAATTAAAGGMTTLGTAAAGLTTVFRALSAAVKAVFLAALVESIIQIGRFSVAVKDLVAAHQALADSQALQKQTADELAATFAQVSRELGINITSMQQLDELVANGTIHFDEQTKSWQRGAAAAVDTAKSLEEYAAQIEAAAKSTQSMADADLAGIFAAAKLDIDQISGGVGKTVAEFATGLDTMAKATHVSGEAIAGYLRKAFDATTNKAELDAIIAKMTVLHQQGRLVGQPYIESMAQATDAAKKMATTSVSGATAYVDALKAQRAAVTEAYKTGEITADSYKQQVGKLNQEIDKTTKAIKQNKQASDTLNDAYKQLGIQSSAALEDIAAKNKKAYSEVKLTNEGLAVQRQAFLVYAESELKAAAATGRYADASLMAQAAALGLSDQLEALIKSIDTTGDSSGKTAEQLKEMLRLMGLVNGGGDQPQETRAEKNAKAIKKAFEDTAEGARSAAAYIANYSNALTDQLKAMSDGTELYYRQLMGSTRATSAMSSEVDQLNAKLADNAAQWRRINAGITLDDIQGHIKQMGLAYLAAERAFLQQDAAVVKMTNRLTDANAVSARTLSQAEGLLKSSRLLGDEQLSGLRTALDDVRSKMAQVKGEADSTLKSLQNELDNLNGNKMAIELRDYQTRVADINAQLAKAQAQGNKAAEDSLRESLRLANEIHRQNMANIKAETEAKQASAKTPTTAANNTSSAATATPLTREITINLGSSRSTIKTDAAGEASLEAMLRQLESLGAINK